MNRTEWELFLRTGLPQAYSFAKAAARKRQRKSETEKSTDGER